MSQVVDREDDIRKAYLSYDFKLGNSLLSARLSSDSPEYIRMAALRDFLTCLTRQSEGANSGFYSKAEYWRNRLVRMEPRSPGNYATTAELSIYRAVLASQFSDYRTSASALLQAYRDIEKSGKLMDHADLNKLSGILGVLFSQVPDKAMKILKVAGIESAGLRSFDGLEDYYARSAPGSADQLEAWLLLVTAYKEFSVDPERSYVFIRQEGDLFPDNPLVCYQSALASLKAGYNDDAICLLENGMKTGGEVSFPLWNYQLGRCYLNRMDPKAGVYLNKFLATPGGETFRHVGTLRLAWHFLVHGELSKAQVLLKEIKQLPESHSLYDKHAVREAESGILPDADMIRLRLLFDGGYYEQCLAKCKALEQKGHLTGVSAVEEQYRKARCLQCLNQTDEAIRSYLQVLAQADLVKSYWLPNSALQLGYLYNKKGQKDLALKYFNFCLDINKYGYREGINRQARAAIEQLKR
jgi:tetratricopeptide (TPR) repeat protein